jgi:hypothetical protein
LALTQGLVGWWQFTEGEGNILHDYANGNNGTLVNNPTWTKAFNGAGALYFNANNYVSAPNQSTLGRTFTITFWFNIIQYPSTNNYVFPIFQRGSTIWLDVRFGSGNQGSLAWELYDGTNYYAFVYSGTPSINTWHFLSWVVDKTGKNAYTYLDGQLIGTTAITNLGNTNSGTNFIIAQPGSVNNNQMLTDVRIYNYVLSPSQINALYWNGPISYAKNYQVGVSTTYQSIPQYQNNSLNNQDLVFSTSQGGWNPVPTDGLGLYYPLDEMQGTIAHDFSGNNNHGTLVNGPTWTTGYYNGALAFNLSASLSATASRYINGPNLFSTSYSQFTLSLWVNPYSYYSSGGYGQNFLYQQNGIFGTYINSSTGALNFAIGINGASWNNYNAGIGSLSFSSWQLLTAVYNSPIITWYKNGQLINSFSVGGPTTTGTNNIWFGCGYLTNSLSAQIFMGYEDDIRFYNRALSQYEVLQLYSTSSVGHIVLNPSITDVTTQTIQNNLVSYYKFDEAVTSGYPWATGNVTYDSSGNGNNGLNYNAPYVTGINGTALQFTGTQGQYVNAPQNFATSSITISAWIYPTSATKLDDNIILSTNAFEVGYNTSLVPVVKLAGVGNTKIVTATSALTRNAWNNTVYIINISSTPSASVQFYNNDYSIAYTTFSWGLTTFSVTNLRIGANEGIFTNITSNEDASCYLDDLRIYNRPLLPTEIGFIYTSITSFVGTISFSSSYITAPQFTTLTISTTSSPPNEQYIVSVIATTNSGANLISAANQTLLVTEATPYTIGMAVYDQNQNTVSAFSIQQNQTFSFSLQIYPISITTYPNNVNLSLSLPLSDYGITGGISTTSVPAGFTQSNPKTVYFSITTSPNAPLTTSYVQIVATDASNRAIQAQAELSVSVVQIPSNQVSQSQSNAYTESIIPFLEVGRLSSYYNIGNSNAVWGSLWSGLVFAGTGTQGVIVGGSEPNVGYSATNMIDLGWGTGRSDPNAGKIIWGSPLDTNSVNILGQGSTGQRKIHLWDNVLLNGKLSMIDNVTTKGNFGALTPIYSAYSIPVSSQNTVVLTFTPPYNGTYRVVATGHVSTVLNPMITYLTYVNGITNTTVSMRFYNDDQTIDSPIIDVTINSAPVSAISIQSICISNVGYFDSVLVFGI